MESRYRRIGISAKVLERLYGDSRASVRSISLGTDITYSKASKAITELERGYGLSYTTDLNAERLGFAEDRLICVRFGTKPETGRLRRYLANRPFVQNAYSAYGDYDLILHVVAPSKSDYLAFEFKTKVELGKYSPVFEVATINDYVEGFLPVSGDLVGLSDRLSSEEKALLGRLVKDSRTRLKDLGRSTGFSAIKILYMIGKLKRKGVINRFTCTVQRPDKKIFMFYTLTASYVPEHKPRLQADFLRQVLSGEDHGDLTSDYSVVCDTSGHFDSALFCNFADTKAAATMGPDLMRKCWAVEKPVTKSCTLSEALKGEWPFQKNGYAKWKAVLRELQKKPMKFEMLE